MVRQGIDWEIILAALLITGAVISGILFLGQQLNQYKIDRLRTEIRETEIEYRSQVLGLRLAENLKSNRCEAMSEWIDESSSDIRRIRKKVAAYEGSSKLMTGEYRVLKKRYMNLLIRNLIEVRQFERSCDRDITNIVYFYSGSCERCKDQGTILTYFSRKYNRNLIVYPLDSDLNLETIEFLEQVYEIESYPSLVIEGEVYRGYRSKQNLTSILEENTNLTVR